MLFKNLKKLLLVFAVIVAIQAIAIPVTYAKGSHPELQQSGTICGDPIYTGYLAPSGTWWSYAVGYRTTISDVYYLYLAVPSNTYWECKAPYRI